jgi:hypothetical protein
MVSFGSLFRLIKSHFGLVLANETSKSRFGLLLVSLVSFGSPFGLVGLLWVSFWSLLGLTRETISVSFGLILVSFGSRK